MHFGDIVVSGLVSGSYYNGGGASDINGLKVGKSKSHSDRTSRRTPRSCIIIRGLPSQYM